MTKSTHVEGAYDAEQIQVLEGLEAVRRRPGMYIGTTDVEGLHHLVWEVVDNAIDEAMAGYCSNIVVILHKDGSVSIEDNGRGIPIDKHSKTGKSALETVLTVLHAGGKFGGGGYKVSGGLHGVGVSVVNALSTRLEATVCRGGKRYVQSYDMGVAEAEIKVDGTSDSNGTTIRFWADASIFESIEFDFQTILNRMRQQAYLVKGLRISVIDARKVEKLDLADVFFAEIETTKPWGVHPVPLVRLGRRSTEAAARHLSRPMVQHHSSLLPTRVQDYSRQPRSYMAEPADGADIAKSSLLSLGIPLMLQGISLVFQRMTL